MTFAPSKKTSRSRTHRRTTNWTADTAKKILDKTSLQYDAEGNVLGLAHFASPITGEYKGKKVLTVGKAKKIKKIKA